MCGTGPYSFTTWNQATDYWRIDAFEACVSHPWPGPYGLSDPAPTTVTETGINTWATRKMLFLGGSLDICYVPEANMFDMLVPGASIGNDYTPIPGIELYYNIPTFETDALFFTLVVAPGSAYTPIVNGNSDPAFFNSTLIRTAFCQALNSSAYISGAFYGEAIQPNTFWAVGLTPPGAYLNSTQLPAWELNYAAVYNDLKAAGVNSLTMSLTYNIGNTERQIAAQEIAGTFDEINAIYGTSYSVTAVGLNWPTFLAAYETGQLPFFIVGWLADFSDADDFAVPFMETGGAFTGPQGFSNATIDAQLHAEEALSAAPVNYTPGSLYEQRNAILETLQEEYIQNAISLPLDQPLARHWSRDYVYGWYYNQLYPGGYFQDDYKSPPTAPSVPVQLDMSGTLLPIVNYTQIYIWQGGMYVGTKFVSGSPVSSNALITPMEYYVEVTRTDSNVGAGILYATLSLYRTPGEMGLNQSFAEDQGAADGIEVNLVPGESANATWLWLEDGVEEVITGSPTGITYTVGASSIPITTSTGALAYNSNPALQSVTNGSFVAKTLVGDIDGNGIVDIFDAIALGIAFGSSTGMANYNPLADLNHDGTVDIYDAVALGIAFGSYVGTY